jgi:hypothetical protein
VRVQRRPPERPDNQTAFTGAKTIKQRERYDRSEDAGGTIQRLKPGFAQVGSAQANAKVVQVRPDVEAQQDYPSKPRCVIGERRAATNFGEFVHRGFCGITKGR